MNFKIAALLLCLFASTAAARQPVSAERPGPESKTDSHLRVICRNPERPEFLEACQTFVAELHKQYRFWQESNRVAGTWVVFFNRHPDDNDSYVLTILGAVAVPKEKAVLAIMAERFVKKDGKKSDRPWWERAVREAAGLLLQRPEARKENDLILRLGAQDIPGMAWAGPAAKFP